MTARTDRTAAALARAPRQNWNRCNHAAARLSALTAALFALALPAASAFASAPDAGSETLDPMLVTASPIATPLSEAMRAVTVITREEIANAPATTLADLLAEVSGLTIRRRGSAGVQADVGIRGSNFEQTLVLLDGVPIRTPQTGHHNLDLPVPLSRIERIEIIKGPGAIQYGGSATGGVINIITRRAEPRDAHASVTLGSHGTRGGAAGFGFTAGATSHLLSASVTRSDSEDPAEPTDADVRQALYTGHADLDRAGLEWGAGALRKRFGAWGFYSADFPDMRERTASRIAWIGGEVPGRNWHASARVYWRSHDDWFRTRIAGTDYINRHATNSAGLKASARRADAHGVTAFGANLRHARIHSNALHDHDRGKLALWMVRRQQLGKHVSAEFGINHVRYSDNGSRWLPSASLSWQINREWRGFVSAARSSRIPSYTELYLATPANRGSATLEAETSNYGEIGVEHVHATQRLRVTVFERHTDDAIDWTRDAGETTWVAHNLGDYRARGAEVEWRWQPLNSRLKELKLAWNRLNVDVTPPADEVKYALRVPRQAWFAHARWALAPAFGFSVDARRPDYRDQGSATLIAARLDWHGARAHAAIEVRNLLDKRIVETGFAPIPGRWFYATVGFDF